MGPRRCEGRSPSRPTYNASISRFIRSCLRCFRSVFCGNIGPLLGRRRYGKISLPNQPLISIVDGDEAVREATKGLMRALGFLAEAFESGEDFLKFDRLHTTACLIADVQMPQMSGLELHRRMIASGLSIPTILITAYPDDGVRARALKSGILCYLTKPFNMNELLVCIRSALGRDQAAAGQDDISS